MSEFVKRLEEKMLSVQYADDDDCATDTAFMAGAKAALLLLADEIDDPMSGPMPVTIYNQGLADRIRTLAREI